MFREQVLDALRNGGRICQSRSYVHGDNLINSWTSQYALQRLALEEGLEYASSLVTYPENKKPPKNGIELSSYRQRYWQTEEVFPLGIVGYKLQLAADRLDLSINSDEFNLVPQPFVTDFAPLNTFNEELVVNEGEILRNKLKERFSQIVVIAQSGSQAEKRFTNKQVADLAEGVKVTDPNAFVAVISDKDLLANLVPTMWRRIRNNPQPFTLHAFPYRSLAFKRELENNIFEQAVDRSISGFDINQFCIWFYAADLLIATDSYWSWLGCGTKSLRPDRQGKLQSTDAIILYTIANPSIWRVPGAIQVESEGLEQRRIASGGQFQFLSYDEYYVPPHGSVKSNDPQRAITQNDIKRVKEKTDKRLSEWLKV